MRERDMGVVAAVSGAFVAVCVALVCGCSGDDGSGAVVVTAGRPDAATTSLTSAPLESEVAAAFLELARTVTPMPVYGLAQLPPDTKLADEWWPVVEGGSEGGYAGSTVNPRIESGQEGEHSAELLLASSGGWLLALANFRGDLGEAVGVEVGSVEGHPAHLYELNGGWLVQWSDGGRWYGLFGRGVPRDIVESTALSMSLVAAE
jgi:hypothetical protein